MGDFSLFLLQSFMKSDENKEYYDLLEIKSNANSDDIKKAYKKASLTYHPDKLKQRGAEATPEERQKFVKIKEAYEVLSDPKRRKIYDKLGTTGLKFYENPSSITPQELLRNFQRNRGSRLALAFFLLLIFASLLVLPVLFSLKCDGQINQVPWTALWTPMWIYDFMSLVVVIMFILQTSHTKKHNANVGMEDTSSNTENEDPEENYVPLSTKLYLLTETVLFTLIQIFVMIRLDNYITWSWFEVFIPWYLHDGFKDMALLYPAFLHTIPLPDHAATSIDSPTHQQDPETGGGLEEDLLRKQYINETEYLQKCIEKTDFKNQFFINILRIWQVSSLVYFIFTIYFVYDYYIYIIIYILLYIYYYSYCLFSL